MKWYTLAQPEQHAYKIIIQRCQNPSLFTLGGFAPLNLDTCVTDLPQITRMMKYIKDHDNLNFITDLFENLLHHNIDVYNAY